MNAPPQEPDVPVAHAGFWKRRVGDVVVAQFKQGITPEKIALTVALGGVLAVFPILGSTTALCALAAFCLGLNQPIIQLVNYFCYPLQLALLLPFYRAGEWLGAPHLALSIPQLVERFRAGPLRFVADFAGIALGGIGIWCVVAPLAAALLYAGLRPPLRGVAARLRRDAPTGS